MTPLDAARRWFAAVDAAAFVAAEADVVAVSAGVIADVRAVDVPPWLRAALVDDTDALVAEAAWLKDCVVVEGGHRSLSVFGALGAAARRERCGHIELAVAVRHPHLDVDVHVVPVLPPASRPPVFADGVWGAPWSDALYAALLRWARLLRRLRADDVDVPDAVIAAVTAAVAAVIDAGDGAGHAAIHAASDAGAGWWPASSDDDGPHDDGGPRTFGARVAPPALPPRRTRIDPMAAVRFVDDERNLLPRPLGVWFVGEHIAVQVDDALSLLDGSGTVLATVDVRGAEVLGIDDNAVALVAASVDSGRTRVAWGEEIAEQHEVLYGLSLLTGAWDARAALGRTQHVESHEQSHLVDEHQRRCRLLEVADYPVCAAFDRERRFVFVVDKEGSGGAYRCGDGALVATAPDLAGDVAGLPLLLPDGRVVSFDDAWPEFDRSAVEKSILFKHVA